MARELFIGLMSGTSLDGVDAVLADIGTGGTWQGVLVHHHVPYDAALRRDLLALNASGPDELHRAAEAAHAVTLRYAEAVSGLLAQGRADAVRRTADDAVVAIGAHGQTVRHRPHAFGVQGYTLQLLHPATLAELTGVDVVADLRARDVAAGGEGAPLVPAFHHAVFARPGADVVVVNIGGIANLSVLPAAGPVLGFDCGPGNALMDEWAERHLGTPFDADGAWAAQGRVQAPLLAALRSEPYFDAPVPKSTGRDLFHSAWLQRHLSDSGALAPADVQATLCELTAGTIADAVRRHAAGHGELLVCGGGARNGRLMARLAALLAPMAVRSTAERGLPPMQVEAAAFAWLAWAHVKRRPGNLSAVTGAAGPRVLGALYPGPAPRA